MAFGRALAALVLLILLFGCLKPEGKEVAFSFTYRIIGPGGVQEGSMGDSVIAPRNAGYFHIRMNITNLGNETHYLRVLDQEAGEYKTTLPIYSRERVNGAGRDWRALDWAGAMGIGSVEREEERLVPFAPGEEKSLEAPIFFFNEKTAGTVPQKTELSIEIVNASGSVIGEKTITITLTG